MSLPPFPLTLREVLHVEDSAADAELISMLLVEEWPQCRIQRVYTREDFLSALTQKKFDVILSDFSLPKFDGLAALTLARGSPGALRHLDGRGRRARTCGAAGQGE